MNELATRVRQGHCRRCGKQTMKRCTLEELTQFPPHIRAIYATSQTKWEFYKCSSCDNQCAMGQDKDISEGPIHAADG